MPTQNRQHDNQRSDGDINIPRNNHHRHTNRSDGNIGVAAEHVHHVARAEEAVVIDADVGNQDNQGDHQNRFLVAKQLTDDTHHFRQSVALH